MIQPLLSKLIDKHLFIINHFILDLSLKCCEPRIKNFPSVTIASLNFTNSKDMSGLIDKIIAGASRSITNSSSSLDILESNIEVIDNGQVTTLTLQRCRKMILSRYHKLLIFIAWKPFAQKRITAHPYLWKILNILYAIFVILNITYANVYETLFCEGQVATYTREASLLRTTEKTATTTLPSTTVNEYNENDYWPFAPMSDDTTTVNTNANLAKANVALCHEVTIYAIPNTLHVLAFLIGFWYFRIRENEELDALMERIFLQAHYMLGAQERLIRNSTLFLISGVFWIMLILLVSGLSIAAYGTPDLIFQKFNIEPSWLIISLACVQFLGKIYYSCTYIAIIVNYTIQCEFIIWAIKSIILQLHERNFLLKDSLHEILRLKQLMSRVNGSLSKLASLCVANFALKVIIGFSILIQTNENEAVGWIYRILFPLVWAPVLIFPLIQAARVTKTGEKLRHLACELRVFGYKDSELYDLDSLILFVNSAKLRAKLFSMPIKPSYLISTFAVIGFTLLLLFQTNVIHTTL